VYLGDCINRLGECAQLGDDWAMRFPVRLPLLMTALPLFNVLSLRNRLIRHTVDCRMGPPLGTRSYQSAVRRALIWRYCAPFLKISSA
jgi:hypothetical protein